MLAQYFGSCPHESCVGVARRFASLTFAQDLGEEHTRRKSRDGFARDTVAKFASAVGVRLDAVGPDVKAGATVNQTGVAAEGNCALRNRSFDEITHAELVRMQKERKEKQKAAAEESAAKKVVKADSEWSGDDFVKQSNALARN